MVECLGNYSLWYSMEHAIQEIRFGAPACKACATAFEQSLWHLFTFKHYLRETYLCVSTSYTIIYDMSLESSLAPDLLCFPSLLYANERKQKLGLTPNE